MGAQFENEEPQGEGGGRSRMEFNKSHNRTLQPEKMFTA